MTRLMLGTAQWGSGYGVTNTAGRLPDATIDAIVTAALRWGIRDVDTAHGYGDAEQRLAPHAASFTVTTKLAGAHDIGEQFRGSLQDLDVERVHAVLVHDWDALPVDDHPRVTGDLGRLLDAGMVERVGVSVYDESGVTSATSAFAAHDLPLGVVQVPASVIDRRLDDSPALMALHEGGAEIVARSVFLQGLLLASGGGRADHPDVVRFREDVTRTQPGASLVQACLAHAASLPWATHVVVGATSAAELDEIGRAWQGRTARPADAGLRSDDLDLIDPRRW